MKLKTKFDPTVYAALKDAGMSNREIARHLGVDEASVRRGLKLYVPREPRQPIRRYLLEVYDVDG